MKTTDWHHLLACPQCKASLMQRSDALECSNCQKTFEGPGEVFWLLPGSEGDRQRLKTADGAAMVAGYRQPSPFISSIRKVISSEFFPGKAWRRAKANALDQPGHTLIIGSGITRYPKAIHLDLDDFPGVDVVGDAHQLPFQSRSMDAVICEVVLEHAAEPLQILAETRRVLKPKGKIFFVVPFVFPFHGHPNDYRRWSKEGLASDFSAFQNLEIGIMGGPCSSMVNLLSEWGYVLTGMRFPKGYTLVKGALTACLFPLKFLDIIVNRFPEAHRLASTLYITGEAPDEVAG